MNKINLFPTYNPENTSLKVSMGLYEFSYEKDDDIIHLSYTTDLGKEHVLEDENGVWNIKEYGINIRRKIILENADTLFSPNKHALACKYATIGIGFTWSSKESSQRGAVEIGRITKNFYDFDKDLEFTFQRGSIRGTVEMNIVLFIKKYGNPEENEGHFANNEGLIIGVLDTFLLKIDGDGSFFPVRELSDRSAPLWDVQCIWSDPSIDPFSESVAILLNVKDNNYKYLNRKSSEYNRDFAIEVMSNAIFTIIQCYYAKNKTWDLLNDAEPGSVAAAFCHFRDVLEWKLSDPIQLSKDIREFLYKNISK